MTLESAASDLNQVTDALNAKIKKLEEYLKGLNLGVETWVSLDGAPQCGNVEQAFIGYAKIGSVWGIALRLEDKFWLFKDGPRYLRADATVKLSELFEEVQKTAVRVTADLQLANARVDQVLEKLRDAKSPYIIEPEEAASLGQKPNMVIR